MKWNNTGTLAFCRITCTRRSKRLSLSGHFFFVLFVAVLPGLFTSSRFAVFSIPFKQIIWVVFVFAKAILQLASTIICCRFGVWCVWSSWTVLGFNHGCYIDCDLVDIGFSERSRCGNQFMNIISDVLGGLWIFGFQHQMRSMFKSWSLGWCCRLSGTTNTQLDIGWSG